MSTITVSCFKQYRRDHDAYLVGDRMATPEAIVRLGDGFSSIPGTALEIDAADLDPEAPFAGMTKVDYADCRAVGLRAGNQIGGRQYRCAFSRGES